jgi:hypothetical protein
MVTSIELFESPDLISLDFCFWAKRGVCKREVDTQDELLGRISVVAVHINQRENQL